MSNLGLIIQIIAILIFVIGIYLSVVSNKSTVFTYLIDFKNWVNEKVAQKNTKLTPKLNIGVVYDRKGIPPTEIYDFSISQVHNPDAVSVINLSMRVAFQGAVQEIHSSFIPASVTTFSGELLFWEDKGEVVYRSSGEQVLKDRGISISIQQVENEKENLNTNVINFYTKELPADALIWSFITVDPTISRQVVSSLPVGSYEGTYEYYIEGKKFTEKFSGKIKGDTNLEDAKVWFDKAYAFNDLGKYEEALDAYNEALKIDPDKAVTWYNKGYNMAINISLEYANAWHNKGWTLNQLGRYEEAIIAFNKSIELNSQFAGAWRNKAVALGRLGKYKEALAAYETANKLDPSIEIPKMPKE
jgi:hypothetical protein